MIAWTDAAWVRPTSAVLAAVAAIAVGAPLLPLAHMTFLGVGAPLAPAMAPFLLLAAAAVWPLAKIERGYRAALVAVALLLIMSAGVALRVRTAPLAPTVPVYALDK